MGTVKKLYQDQLVGGSGSAGQEVYPVTSTLGVYDTDNNQLQGVLDKVTTNLGLFTCGTAAATAAKTVSASKFVLMEGGSVKIKFTYANSADSPTLAIGSTAAKPIMFNGSAASASNSWGAGEIVKFFYDGTNWVGSSTSVSVSQNTSTGHTDINIGSDSYPVASVGDVSQLGQQVIYDVTANNDGATFASLSALLSNENLSTLIPIVVRRGGMSIRFVQSSDNNYVQYRLMSNSFSTDITAWQEDDDISNYIAGHYVYTDGTIEADASCALVKDFIPVNAGDFLTIVKAASKYFVFYDENKQRINAASISSEIYSVVAPSGTHYFKVSFILSKIADAYIFNYTQNKTIWLPKDSTIGEELKTNNLLCGNYIPNAYLGSNDIANDPLYVLPKKIKVVEGDVVKWDKTKATGRIIVYNADGTKLDSWLATSYSSITVPANADSFSLGILKDSGAVVTVNDEIVWKQIDSLSDIQLKIEKLADQQKYYHDNLYGKNYKDGYRLNSSGTEEADSSSFLIEGYVPCKVGDTILYNYGSGSFCTFNANGEKLDSWGAMQPSRTIVIPNDALNNGCVKCRASFLKTEKSNASLVINGKTMWVAEEAGTGDDLKEKVDAQKYLSLENSERIDNLDSTKSKVNDCARSVSQLLNEDDNILFKRIYESTIIKDNYSAVSEFIDVSSSRRIKVTNKESRVAYFLFYNQQKEYVNYSSIAANSYAETNLPSSVYYIRVTYIIGEDCKPASNNTEVINRDNNEIVWKPQLTWYANDNNTDILHLHPYKETYPLLANLKNNINPVTVQPYGDKPLSLMFFSDLHASLTPLGRMMEFAKEYTSVIDDVVAGGDNVNVFQDSFSFWSEKGANSVLAVMGNHDCIYMSGTAPTIGGTAVKVQSVGWSAKEVYDKEIAPFVSDLSGVTLVTNKCYWYKDYANSKIRLIGLDDYHWKEQITLVDNSHPTTYDDGTSVDTGEQLTWFESVLADAKAKNLSVVVVHHAPARWDNPIRCSFTSLDFQNNVPTDPTSQSGPAYTREPFVAVQNFIDGGGKFVCWLTGHLHQDAVGVIKGFTDQFQMTIDTCLYGRNVSGITYGECHGSTAHYPRTNNADLFDIVSVDTYTKTVSLVRIGCNYDRRGRHIGAFVWDYENKQMISCD